VTADAGENVIGLWLGNGFQNNPGGHIWDFDKSAFRSAPMVAVSVVAGEETLLTSSVGFKIAPSPLLFDDYRFGDAGVEPDVRGLAIGGSYFGFVDFSAIGKRFFLED
jgi:hypothetical protein